MYHKTVLDNGVKLISEPVSHMKSVSLGIWVNVGSRDEGKEENGITHFIEHMIFKGTRNRNSLQIAKELDVIGGHSNAFTGKENTCFHARVLGRHFDRAVDILSDIFLNATFDSGDIERERQVILQEIGMVEDSPEDNIHELFSGFFWSDHPIGQPILGSSETVSGVEKKRLIRHMENVYTPERTIVVAAGNVDHQDMVDFFSPLFEVLERKGDSPLRNGVASHSGIHCEYKDLGQVHLCLGSDAPPLSSDKRFACAIFNTILGGSMSSRLFQEIRENQGLAYAVYSFILGYTDTAALSVYVATEAGHVNPVLEAVQREVQKIKEGGLSGEDLNAAKEHLVGGIYLASESTDSRLMRIARNEILFGRYISYEELAGNLERVTMDDVVEIAGDIFREGRISLVTLGPFAESDVDLSCLQFGS